MYLLLCMIGWGSNQWLERHCGYHVFGLLVYTTVIDMIKMLKVQF